MPEQAIQFIAVGCLILGVLALFFLSKRLEQIVRQRYPDEWDNVVGTPEEVGISMSRRPLLLFALRKPLKQLNDSELKKLVRLSDIALFAVLVPILYLVLISS